MRFVPSVLFQEKYGSLSATGCAKESVYGTPVAATSFVPATENTFTSDPGFFSPEVMQAIRDAEIYKLYGEEKDIGAITAPMFPSNGIQYLVYAIGTDAVTGTTAPYTHTVSEANVLSSMTVEKNIGNAQSLQFAGARVGKYSVKAATGNTAAEFTADLVAQSVAILDVPSTVQVVNEEPFVFAEYTLTSGGQTIAQATNFQLDIDNGLKETYTFNQSHELQFLTPTILKVSGTFDVVFDSLDATPYDFFTQMKNGTEAALSFTMQHPASGGSIAFTLPRVVLSKTNQETKAGAVVMEVINFEGLYNLGQSPLETIGVVVTNGISAAY